MVLEPGNSTKTRDPIIQLIRSEYNYIDTFCQDLKRKFSRVGNSETNGGKHGVSIRSTAVIYPEILAIPHCMEWVQCQYKVDGHGLTI